MIVLVGFMGAGKTVVGRLLAAELGLRFVDVDTVVAQRELRSIGEIFSHDGEAAFRAMESAAAAEALNGPDAVVSLGGGALTDPHTRALLETATVVHLDVTFEEAIRRVGHDEGRPMLARDPERLFNERLATYRDVADVTIETDGTTPEEVARDVKVRLTSAAR